MQIGSKTTMPIPCPPWGTKSRLWTLRKREDSKKRFKFSCSRIIMSLLALQVSMFLVIMKATHRNTSITSKDYKEHRREWVETLTKRLNIPPRVKDDDNYIDEETKEKLAQFEEGDEMQNRVIYSDDHSSEALDNYGSRRHLAKKAEWNRSSPYLIVGGSDGSGTRAVVNHLMSLGTFMHYEDRTTMDIHGSEMFKKGGWPPLVKMVFNETHSANYELQDLSEEVRTSAIEELTKLRKSIDKKAESKLRRVKKSEKHATAIFVGWKAPISMVLLPLLREVFGEVKFLHVVRDGRDVALSDNQSPVKKFYNTFYGLPLTPEPDQNKTTIYAMQLWNDWNYQVMKWGTSHSDGETFDYLNIRTEDLVNNETKFHALLQLADFVGSKKTVAELCCMSVKQVKDMGKSAASFGDLSKARNRAGPNGREFLRDIFEGSHREGPPRKDWRNDMEAVKREHLGPEEREDAERLKHDEIIQKRKEFYQHLQEMRQAKADPYARAGGLSAMEKRQHELELMKEKEQKSRRRRLLGFNPRERVVPLITRRQAQNLPGRTREAPEKVMARYGKWVKALEDKPELSETLHKLGSTALEAFGYNPPAAFLDPPKESFDDMCQQVLDAHVCPQ